MSRSAKVLAHRRPLIADQYNIELIDIFGVDAAVVRMRPGQSILAAISPFSGSLGIREDRHFRGRFMPRSACGSRRDGSSARGTSLVDCTAFDHSTPAYRAIQLDRSGPVERVGRQAWPGRMKPEAAA